MTHKFTDKQYAEYKIDFPDGTNYLFTWYATGDPLPKAQRICKREGWPTNGITVTKHRLMYSFKRGEFVKQGGQA